MKKLLSLALIIAMLSMSVAVFAAVTPDATNVIDDNAITISGTSTANSSVSIVIFEIDDAAAITANTEEVTAGTSGINTSATGVTNVKYIGQTTADASGAFNFTFKINTADEDGTEYQAWMGASDVNNKVVVNFKYTPVSGVAGGNKYDANLAEYSDIIGAGTKAQFFPLKVVFDDNATNAHLNISKWEVVSTTLSGVTTGTVGSSNFFTTFKRDPSTGYLLSAYLYVPANLTISGEANTVTLRATYVEDAIDDSSAGLVDTATTGTFESTIRILPPAKLSGTPSMSNSGTEWTLTATNDSSVLAYSYVNGGFTYKIAGGSDVTITTIALADSASDTFTYTWDVDGYSAGEYTVNAFVTNKYSQQLAQDTKLVGTVTIDGTYVPYTVSAIFDSTYSSSDTIAPTIQVKQNGKVVSGGYKYCYVITDLYTGNYITSTGAETTTYTELSAIPSLAPGYQYSVTIFVAGEDAANWDSSYRKVITINDRVEVENGNTKLASDVSAEYDGDSTVTVSFSGATSDFPTSDFTYAAIVYSGDLVVGKSAYSTSTTHTIEVGLYDSLKVIVYAKDASGNAYRAIMDDIVE